MTMTIRLKEADLKTIITAHVQNKMKMKVLSIEFDGEEADVEVEPLPEPNNYDPQRG